MKQIKQYFLNLSERERKLVTIAGIMILLIFLLPIIKNMGFLFKPSLSSAVISKKNDYTSLKPKIAELKQLQASEKIVKKLYGKQLYQELSSNPPRLATKDDEQPVIKETNDNVEITYQSVAFDDLVLWIGRQKEQYGITVVSANFKKDSEQDGFVSAVLLLD